MGAALESACLSASPSLRTASGGTRTGSRTARTTPHSPSAISSTTNTRPSCVTLTSCVLSKLSPPSVYHPWGGGFRRNCSQCCALRPRYEFPLGAHHRCAPPSVSGFRCQSRELHNPRTTRRKHGGNLASPTLSSSVLGCSDAPDVGSISSVWSDASRSRSPDTLRMLQHLRPLDAV